MIRICIIVECGPKSKAYLCRIRAFLWRHGTLDEAAAPRRPLARRGRGAAAKKTRQGGARLAGSSLCQAGRKRGDLNRGQQLRRGGGGRRGVGLELGGGQLLGARARGRQAAQGFQGVRILDADGALVNRDQADFIEGGQGAAHRFQGQAQVAADFMARHAQVEQLARVAHLREAVGQRDEEARHAGFGAQGAQHADHRLFAHQFAAHHAVHDVFQFQVHAAQRRQLLERQQDQVAVGQRHRFRGVMARVDAVDAQHVALHGKTQYLFIAEFIDEHGFQEAGIDDVQGVERLADGVHALARLELHVLEQQFIGGDGAGAGDMQQVAYLLQVRPKPPLALAPRFHRRGGGQRCGGSAGFRRLRGQHVHLLVTGSSELNDGVCRTAGREGAARVQAGKARFADDLLCDEITSQQLDYWFQYANNRIQLISAVAEYGSRSCGR